MTKTRVAVVGTGILGKRHARVFHELEEAELVGVVNRSLEKAAEVGTTYGVPAYIDLERMLEEVACDAVAVATPDHLHFQPVMTALSLGKHVLVEKPLATVLSEARRMVDEARRHNLVLQVNYSQRFVAEYAWIKEQIQQGVIGNPVMVTSSKQDTVFVPTRMINWAAGTSPIFFMSSHDLDLVSWFLESRVTRVIAHERRGVLEGLGIDVHDGVDALLTYESGAAANFHSSWIHPNSYPHLTTDRMTIIGENGLIHFEGQERRVACYAAAGGKSVTFSGPQTATEIDGRIEGAFKASLAHFLHCVRTGAEPLTSAARTLHVTELQTAILRAISHSEPVLLASEVPPMN